MARRLALLVFILSLFAAVPRAQAQFTWFHTFKDSVVTDFKRNNCWPEPFLRPDRAAVRVPFVIMVNNGWQLQNTISDHHFDEATGELTVAGENKIYWILNNAPKQHRTVYVKMSRDPEVTAQRMQIVQAFAQGNAPVGTLARVEATSKEPYGWSAEQVDSVTRAFQTSAPPPRLSSVSSSSNSSSGSSSGSSSRSR